MYFDEEDVKMGIIIGVAGVLCTLIISIAFIFTHSQDIELEKAKILYNANYVNNIIEEDK